jgi:serine/threonine protein kinase
MPEQRVNILVYRPDGTLIAQYLLGDGEHLIGRDIHCPVYLDSEHISRNHAKLQLSHDGIQIEDLNSTAGTYLDGVAVRGKLRIKPGQKLQVGDLTVELQLESEGQIGPGSRLGDGRYTLIRLLGRGGMGEVWLAKDEQLDEEVALKKLPPEVGADAMALADMRREVQKSRALSHPNIIRIHDLIQKAGEDPLISLEYVDGTDLTAIAATKTNGVFGWEEIKDWILQLVSALEYAHEEKIVHRDLKPGNIMISRKGRLKLADFGIAATVADSLSRSSIQGFISGTTLYMSPQQMEGTAPRETDDIYAFGATLYELLTSRAPFYTGNVEHQVLQVTPTPPSQRLAEFGFISEVPPHINELVMACLAKVPESRPQSMTAIRDWIQSEGKAKGAIPKVSTKTIKMRAPVAVVGQPGGDVQQGGSRRWRIIALGAFIIIMSFVIGILFSRGGKKDEPTLNSDSNGSTAVLPASTATFTSDPSDPQNVIVEAAIRSVLKKPEGELTQADLTKVTFLDLSGTQITDADLKEVAKLENLTYLKLSVCKQITGVGLKELAKLEKLTRLELSDTNLTDAGLKELAKLENLTKLYFAPNNITDAGLKEVTKLGNLTTLWLHNTQITGAGLKEVAKLKTLTYLDLRGCTQITATDLKELAKLEKLTNLILSGEQFTVARIAEFKTALPNCQISH